MELTAARLAECKICRVAEFSETARAWAWNLEGFFASPDAPHGAPG
jgi:hypothetical protein